MKVFVADGNLVVAENETEARERATSHMLSVHSVHETNITPEDLRERVNGWCECELNGGSIDGPWYFGPGHSHGTLCGFCGYCNQGG